MIVMHPTVFDAKRILRGEDGNEWEAMDLKENLRKAKLSNSLQAIIQLRWFKTSSYNHHDT